MQVLIIGGAGFVGSYLIDQLLQERYSVAVTKLPNEKLFHKEATVFDLDILELDSIEEILAKVKPTYIFHLAAQSSVSLSWKNPALTADINIKGSINLLEAVKKLNFRTRVLMIGSGEEYGFVSPEEIPISEENRTRPGNIYAVTKLTQNLLGKIYADAYSVEVINVRAFNHIGPKQETMFVVPDFCKQVAEIELGKREPIIYTGNLEVKRDFTDVRDIVRAYTALIKDGQSGETYNVGSGKAVSIQEILQLILKQTNKKIVVQKDKSKLRPIDVPVIEAGIQKLNNSTGWTPQITLEQTIKDTYQYWRERVLEE